MEISRTKNQRLTCQEYVRIGCQGLPCLPVCIILTMLTVPGFENVKATTGRDFLNPKVNGLQSILRRQKLEHVDIEAIKDHP